MKIENEEKGASDIRYDLQIIKVLSSTMYINEFSWHIIKYITRVCVFKTGEGNA
jgi:hypothetical protein